MSVNTRARHFNPLAERCKTKTTQRRQYITAQQTNYAQPAPLHMNQIPTLPINPLHCLCEVVDHPKIDTILMLLPCPCAPGNHFFPPSLHASECSCISPLEKFHISMFDACPCLGTGNSHAANTAHLALDICICILPTQNITLGPPNCICSAPYVSKPYEFEEISYSRDKILNSPPGIPSLLINRNPHGPNGTSNWRFSRFPIAK